jgi:hypothetical protein
VMRPATELSDPSRIAMTSPWRPHRRTRGNSWMMPTEMPTVNGGARALHLSGQARGGSVGRGRPEAGV